MANPHPTFPSPLVGPRVVVRPFDLKDASAMKEAVDEARPTLLPWMPWALNEEPIENYIERIGRFQVSFELGTDFTLGLFDGASGRFLGGTGLHRIDWSIRSFDIGYWIRPTATGQGLVTESVELLTECAFEVLKARRLSITCAAGNEKSAAIAIRLGFKEEGLLRNALVDAYDCVHDRRVFALTDADYSEKKKT